MEIPTSEVGLFAYVMKEFGRILYGKPVNSLKDTGLPVFHSRKNSLNSRPEIWHTSTKKTLQCGTLASFCVCYR